LTIPLLLPVAALIAAPVPDQQTAPPAAPPPVTAPAQPGVAAPAVQSTPAQTNAPPSSAAPELQDAMADPATATPAQVQAAADGHYPGDPLEGFNRAMFGLHQGLDKALYRPVAMGYKHVVPKPARDGLRNAFSNLNEPIVFLNYLLQLKFGKAAATLMRFTLNSTLGIAGLFDVAKTPSFKLPHHDNSFGNTLAYYGVKPGPYLFLPLIGPSTLRDALGGPLDGAVLPTAVGKPFTTWEYQVGSGAIVGLDQRAEADPELKALFGGAVDPYATLRSVWLQNRAAEVSDLHHHDQATPDTAPELGDPLADPAAGKAPPHSDARELQDPMSDPAAAPQKAPR
jgi:phospholipid-binding lipoprotein MlaA